MQNRQKRGRPRCRERISDPLVAMEVPRSIRQQLSSIKANAGCTYGEVIAALLLANDSASGDARERACLRSE